MAKVGSDKYTYECIQDFPKLPSGETFGMGSDIAVDSQDQVYVFQRKDPPVRIFDREGNHLRSWGTSAIRHPHGLTIVDDIAYTTDRDDSVAVIFTLDGKPLHVFGKRGVHSDTGCQKAGAPVPRAAGPFNFPTRMSSSPSGDIYVTDGYRNARVHRYSKDGELINSWGQPGKGPGQFHLPHSVAVHPDGRVFIADRANGRVQIFTREGEFLNMWTDMAGPNDIVRDKNGIFYVCEQQEGRTQGEGFSDTKPGYVSIWDENGHKLARWETRPGHGLCVDSRGDIYLSLPNGKSVDKYILQ